MVYSSRVRGDASATALAKVMLRVLGSTGVIQPKIGDARVTKIL